MKNLFAILLLLFFPSCTPVTEETREAAGLPRGQCTWYAFLRAQEAGWKIRFDKPHGRHANRWWNKVINAQKSTEPKEGSIMVLDAWDGNPYGHVAYVEKVTSKKEWIITHANFGLGTAIKQLDGVKIYQARCQQTDDGILLQGSQQVFKLQGFLFPE